MKRKEKVMKITRKCMSIILALMLVLSFAVPSMAKTQSDKIAAPSGNTVVFTIGIGNKTVSFTQDDITGKTSYKTQTNTYAAKVDGEQAKQDWTGVMLSDLLAAAEKKLNVKLPDDAMISANAVDGYVVGFSVEDVRDPDNRYMVSSDPVKNYNEDDSSVKYDNSYIRILRGDEDILSNVANIRCVTGITIKNSDGSQIDAGKKTQGGDVENAIFYIAVKESADSPFKFYYYTRDEISSYDDINECSYVDHSIDKVVNGRGASVANLLADITDANITDDMIVQYAETDGFHADTATDVEDSDFKDKVGWLSGSHVTTGGDTLGPADPVVSLTSWTTYAVPDENHVNSTEWEDADENSGYVRIYRQRGSAEPAVFKTVMGVVVSYDGQQFTGKSGYTLSAKSDKGVDLNIIESATGKVYKNQTVKGLVPGLKWTVKAPEISGAAVSGSDKITVTASETTDTPVVFTYKEGTYLTVDGKPYTRSELEKIGTQTPTVDEVEAHGTPYGYYDAMYYRYQGVWLKDLASGKVKIDGKNGTSLIIDAADIDKYFVATGNTQSKADTNVSEGKRFTFAYDAPRIIIPSDGTLVGEDEALVPGNKKVTVSLDAAVSITGNYVPPKFSDLGNYGWAENAISALCERGVVNGIGGGLYSPAANIKRGDFMLMLYRAYGFKAEKTSGNFADVPEGSYYYDAIAAAKELGIAKGDGKGFSPEKSISRQEAMTLIYRTVVIEGIDMSQYKADLSTFKDSASVADWAVDPVTALVGSGVINGADGKINPNGNMTRAEMAVALYRALENLK